MQNKYGEFRILWKHDNKTHKTFAEFATEIREWCKLYEIKGVFYNYVDTCYVGFPSKLERNIVYAAMRHKHELKNRR